MIKLLLILMSIVIIVLGVIVALKLDLTIGAVIMLAGSLNLLLRK